MFLEREQKYLKIRIKAQTQNTLKKEHLCVQKEHKCVSTNFGLKTNQSKSVAENTSSMKKNFGLKANQTSGVAEVSECMKENGGVAQLGEHLPCKQGVDSSILFISTKLKL